MVSRGGRGGTGGTGEPEPEPEPVREREREWEREGTESKEVRCDRVPDGEREEARLADVDVRADRGPLPTIAF